MSQRPHILVVNGRKVRQPVFVIGAPHSGADLIARALKQSAGFHVTIGQPAVLSVVYAFARSPSIQRRRGEAAVTVLRDAFAQAWQVTSHSCLECSSLCKAAGGVRDAGACIAERDIARYGDASPDLMYCAESLVEAFPDARLVQLIRDGRDAVAAMLGDAETMAWFKHGTTSIETEFPYPFFGVETEADRAAWPGLSVVGKCAMRWRGSVRNMARLRSTMSAEQLTTLRYEQVIRQPEAAADAVAEFLGADVSPIRARGLPRGPGAWQPAVEAGDWRRLLNAAQVAEVEQVAGTDLRRVGYGA
jgi:hypothetical protein